MDVRLANERAKKGIPLIELALLGEVLVIHGVAPLPQAEQFLGVRSEMTQM